MLSYTIWSHWNVRRQVTKYLTDVGLDMKPKVCISYFYGFSFAEFSPTGGVLQRNIKHLKMVGRNFDRIYLLTLDNRNYSFYFKGHRIQHKPTTFLRTNKLLKSLLAISIGLAVHVEVVKKCDVAFSTPYSIPAVLASKITKRPLIIHFKYDPLLATQGRFMGFSKSLFLKLSTVLSLKSADMIIATTYRLKKRAIQLGVNERKIFVVPNYVDDNLFSILVKTDVRQQFSIPSSQNIILYVGRLAPVKGLGILIKAFSLLDDSKGKKLLIVGEGGIKDKLKRLCKELEVEDNIIFVGNIPYEMVPKYLAAADVVVLPSWVEGNPKSLIEAMVMGKPIVATSVPGIVDLIKNRVSGILVPPGDPVSLAKAIFELFNNKNFAAVLGQKARGEALKKFSKKSVLESQTNIYLTLGF